MPIRKCRDLKVYNLSYDSAMNIFALCREFPNREKYSLISQVIRSSRSVPVNIREGFAKRRYKPVFIRPLIDAIGSAEETKAWIDFARDCRYLSNDKHHKIMANYKEITAMLFGLIKNWENFADSKEIPEKD